MTSIKVTSSDDLIKVTSAGGDPVKVTFAGGEPVKVTSDDDFINMLNLIGNVSGG